MADENLRLLERTARAAADDVFAWLRYVRALQRADERPPEDLAAKVACIQREAPELERIHKGDEVWVEEEDTPWIVGRWRGVVTECFFEEDERPQSYHVRYRVRPAGLDDEDARPIRWRTRPLPEQRVRGLVLTRHDRLELIARAVDQGA